MSLPTPNTRKEQYLNAIATGNASGLPTPITREEEYLDAIAKSGGGSGDGDMKKSVYDSDLDVAGAGGIKAFVNSAVAGKVDKVEGKGLSTNDYTDEDKAIVDSVTGALAEKADTDDIPDLVSDNLAKGILGNETVLSTDTVPFVSKIMGAGKYQRKKFVGCSFVWNQLVVADAKSASYTWNTLTGAYNKTIYSFASEKTVSLYAGHKYLISIYGERTISNNNYFRLYLDSSNDAILIGVWNNGDPNGIVKAIISPESTITITSIRCNNNAGKSGYDEGDTVSFDNLFIVDLTQLFGSTAIADAIYNLEQATAGAGIAKLKELGFFTEDYYAYDAGSVQSVDIKEYAVTGKNLLDPSKSTINTAAAIFFKNNNILFKRGVTYTASYKGNITPTIYFAKPGTIGSYVNQATKTLSFTPEEDCYGWIQFVKVGGGLDIDITKYQLEIGSTATAYEPYHKTTYPLTPTELRGVPKIDANNNIYCDGDEYASDGDVTRKYGIVDLGTLEYTYSASDGGYFKSNLPLAKAKELNTCISSWGHWSAGSWATFTSNEATVYIDTSHIFYIHTYGYTDANEFKSFVSGVYLVYLLDTPTTETLTPFDYPQSVGSLEEIADYKVEQEDRDVAIPTGHVTEYMGKGGEFTLPTLPETPSVLAYDGHNFFWKPETA